jgi:predicted transposase/invertase (TIGR01784 family)
LSEVANFVVAVFEGDCGRVGAGPIDAFEQVGVIVTVFIPDVVVDRSIQNAKMMRLSDRFFMYDNTCKYLAENFSEDIASWLIGDRVSLTELKPTELNVDPIRADSIILLSNQDLILHLEFQTAADDEMQFRMIDYRIRAYRKFPTKRMRQIVIYLKKTTSELVNQTTFEIENTLHRFEVIRLWEQPASIFLESPGLYPFASLAQTDKPELVLRSVASKIEAIGERKVQADLAATASVLAGLVLDKNQVKQILRRDIMRDSVIYQDILEEGLERGRQQERALVVRQLTKKLGNLAPKVQAQISDLSIERVEILGEALLDFTSLTDLEQFLDG